MVLVIGCCDGGSLWNSFGDSVSRAGEVHQLEVVRLGCLLEESVEFVKESFRKSGQRKDRIISVKHACLA